MSNDERRTRNLLRFSWEFTLGDAIQLLVVIVLAVKLWDQVQVHEARLGGDDAQIKEHDGRLNKLEESMAVIQDRQRQAKN